MSITKHRLFKLKISDDSQFSFDNLIEKKINEFLSESNNVYLNHSITVLTEDIEQYGTSKNINKYVLISIIYKDLNSTPFDLKNTSKKVQNNIIKEIENGVIIKEPEYKTKLDSKIEEIEEKLSNVGIENMMKIKNELIKSSFIKSINTESKL